MVTFSLYNAKNHNLGYYDSSSTLAVSPKKDYIHRLETLIRLAIGGFSES